MTKKLLALLLAMCMVFSVCSVSVAFAEESTDGAQQVSGTETPSGDEGQPSQPATNNNTPQEPEEDATVELELDNAYLPNATVVIKGTVTGDDVSVVRVEIICDEDGISAKDTATIKSVSRFESEGVEYKLDDATVGAEYEINVYDDDTDELLASDSFLIKKGATSDSVDDGSNKVTIWIEGLTDRYIDKTVVNLDWVKEPNVLKVAEYVLDEADRNYKSSKKKVTAIASTETGSTYTLKDGSTSKYYEDCEWAYILNGGTSSAMADYDGDWTDIELKGGDEIVLFFGEPGTVGYPMVTMTPDDGIGVKDDVEILVVNQLFDEDGEIESEEPIKGAKVYFIKRGSTSKGTAKTTGSDGIYDFEASSSFISTYQGGEMMVTYYQSSSKPLKMVSVTQDLKTERSSTIQAYVRIEGAHKTLLSRTKSAKIEEYDLYNFMLEVLDDEDIEYETNDDETNFTYFESKTTSGYSNENGDITRDSGWYVAVNDEIYTPDDDLEEVEIFPNDEILFYFGDHDTVPVVYYKIDGELVTEKKVYVYFYSDADMTNPIDDLEVTFEGDDIDKDMETNSDGRITLPTVEYKGTYTLSWGEQVGVRDDECPKAVMGEAELKFTGTSAPSNNTSTGTSTGTTTKIEYECEYCGDTVTKVYTIEYKNREIDVCKSCKNELEEDEKWTDEATRPTEEPTEWETGDYTEVPTEPKGPSKYYPDPNIDSWAVESVNKAHEYGLMSGTAKGWFEPQREITRAEFTAIVCRMLGLDTDAPFEQKFTDVTPSDWHYGYVMAAYNAGYVTGMSDTIFSPSSYITREQMAVLVARIINATGNESDVYLFADGYDVSAWARVSVAAVNKTGLMTGDQFGQFLPKANVTRQTAAIVAVRLYEYLGD
ncbi:MAG: S-layer homology domain-containing protein [Clostridia bacterium]|nr:S-layer homology domain-containing protein [Clostridia bacterium]